MIDWSDRILRTLLFVPGSDQDKLSKVARFGSDAIVIDLEDAVADDEKTAARATTAAAVGTFGSDAITMVRVNGATTGRMQEDIAAVVGAELDAIVVPKVEAAGDLAQADAAIGQREHAAGLAPGSIRLLPIVETPRGLADCQQILDAAPARTLTVAFGAGDYSTEMGIEASGPGVLYARERLAVAARAAGLARPVDGPWLDLEDLEGLAEDSRFSRSLGFQGRVIVYPPQVHPAQRAYSEVADEDADRARRVVAAFEEAEARGVASIRVDGRFIDYPIYRRAQEQLRLHAAYQRTLEAAR